MATEKTKRIVMPKGEQGRTGTNMFGGTIYDEYLTDLQGTAGLEIYDKMRRSDSQIYGALQLVKLPILQAQWTIKASPNDPELGEEIAELVRQVLFGGMEYTWEYVLQQILLMLDFGFIPMEKVWELREPIEGVEFEGLPGDQIVWLKKISPRMPNTVSEWIMNDSTNDLEKIKQTLPTGEELEIDRAKVAMFVHHKEGDNWQGRSVLRSAYKHWYIKDTLEKIDAIGHERASLGIPTFHIQDGYGFDPDSEEGKALLDRLTDIARNLRANEEEFIIMPPGVEFRFESLGQNNEGLLKSIQHHDMHIMVNVMAQFMTLGMTGSGSRAVAEAQQGPFNLELLAITDNIATTVEREIIEDIVQLNYGPRPGYPQIVAKGVVESNQQPLALMVSQLVQYGVIVPDEALENWLRELLDLPTKVAMDLENAGGDLESDLGDEELGDESIDDELLPDDSEATPPEMPSAAKKKQRKVPDSSLYSSSHHHVRVHNSNRGSNPKLGGGLDIGKR